MGIIDTVKDIATLVQKADNIELNHKIIELQAQILGVLDENHSVKSEVRALRERLEFQGSLEFRENMYWRRSANGQEEGPFCSRCWDVDTKAVRLQKLRDGTKFCPGCKRSAPGSGQPEAPQIPTIRRRGWITD